MANLVESSSASQIISYNHAPLPIIKVPFPPQIDAQELITIRESPDGTRKLSTRAPNAFIIFRKQFVKTARDEGHFLPMTVISSMASTAWENEKEEVRAEYKRIAKEAHIKRKAMYPKTNNRRKRKEKWNLVSFQPVNSVSKPVSQEISYPSPTSTTAKAESENANTVKIVNTVNTESINTSETENSITANTENIKRDTNNLIASILMPLLSENYLPQYYPDSSYVSSYNDSPYSSYNESPDLSYNSYNESPDPSYNSFSDGSSNSTSPDLDSNLNTNLYDNAEQQQYPSPYHSIPDDSIQGYESSNFQFYENWNLDNLDNFDNGIIPSISSNLSPNVSTSIATPSIASSSNTPRLDTDFITASNTNNYEFIDFPTGYNDEIIYNNDVILPLITTRFVM